MNDATHEPGRDPGHESRPEPRRNAEAVSVSHCRGRLAVLGCFVVIVAAPGCVEVAQMAAPDRGLLGQAMSVSDEVPAAPAEERPFVGVTLEESLGSLDAMDFVAGLDVVKVDKGSPAAKVGVRAGDRLVEANGAELLSLDQWQSVVDSLSSSAPLRLRVERNAGISEVVVAFETARTEELPASVRFAERWKLRAEFETVAGASDVHVVLRAIFTGSPLLGTDVVAGDTIATMDGEVVRSADALVRALAARDFGDEVRLQFTTASALAADPSGVSVSGLASRDVRVTLWSPPRYVTRLQVPLLFDYRHDPVRDELSFSFIDFWLFAIYDYQREAGSRRHRLLYFLEYSSGVGELSDETVARERSAPGAEGGP